MKRAFIILFEMSKNSLRDEKSADSIAKISLRLANDSDAFAIADIFRPIVETTATSFSTEAITSQSIGVKMREVQPVLPWLVGEIGGDLVGYAYAAKHRSLGAYQWSVETSIYVSPQFHRRGIATRLYSAMLKMLKKQGFYNAYAGITLPNPASVILHEAIGFKKFCEFQNVGFKLGRWHDVGWWRFALQDRFADQPNVPISFERLIIAEPGILASL